MKAYKKNLFFLLVAHFLTIQTNPLQYLLAFSAYNRQKYWNALFNYAPLEASQSSLHTSSSSDEEKEDIRLSDFQNCPEKVADWVKLLKHFKEHGRSYIDPRGLLLYGPPGTGKTTLAKAIAGDVGFHSEYVQGSQFASKYMGEGAERVADLFERLRCLQQPVALIVDEIDAIGSSDVIKQHPEYLATAQRFWAELSDKKNKSIFVIGITNKYSQLEEAFKRQGRFDEHVEIGLPQEFIERESILRFYLSKADIALQENSIKALAIITPGYSGQDLSTIVKKARQRAAIREIGEAEAEDNLLAIFREEIERQRSAVEKILQEGAYYYPMQTPRITLQNIPSTAPGEIWQLVRAFQEPARYTKLDIVPKDGGEVSQGLLLYGPPGNGKSLTAEAFAGQIEATFIPVTASAFNQKYIGEGSRHIEALFERARSYVKKNPGEKVVVFIDELDAIGAKRTADAHMSDAGTMITLLNELNKLQDFFGVFVVAATNKDKILDEALMRRFRTQVEMKNPDEINRKRILFHYLNQRKQNVTRPTSQDELKAIESLIQTTENFSCSDLENLVLKSRFDAGDREKEIITIEDLQLALPKIRENMIARMNRAETDSEFHRRIALQQLRIAEQQRNMSMVGGTLNAVAMGAAAGGPLGAAAAGLAAGVGSYWLTNDHTNQHK